MTKRGPKAYSEEFRREAVRLAEAGTKPLTQIARELGIHLETLRGWRRQARAVGAPAAGSGTVPSLEEENRRLRRRARGSSLVNRVGSERAQPRVKRSPPQAIRYSR